MPYRFIIHDENVETRRPWRGSPCPAIHGRAFLCIVCIIQQYLSSYAIRSRKRACTIRSQVMKPLTLWQKRKKCDDKAPPLCYNQLKALYSCKRHHITVFQVRTTLKRADHFASFYKGHGSFQCFNYPLTAGKLKCRM